MKEPFLVNGTASESGTENSRKLRQGDGTDLQRAWFSPLLLRLGHRLKRFKVRIENLDVPHGGTGKCCHIVAVIMFFGNLAMGKREPPELASQWTVLIASGAIFNET